MDIEDLEMKDVKLSKNSITVKDDYDKTRGIVTRCMSIYDMKFKDLVALPRAIKDFRLNEYIQKDCLRYDEKNKRVVLLYTLTDCCLEDELNRNRIELSNLAKEIGIKAVRVNCILY